MGTAQAWREIRLIPGGSPGASQGQAWGAAVWRHARLPGRVQRAAGIAVWFVRWLSVVDGRFFSASRMAPCPSPTSTRLVGGSLEIGALNLRHARQLGKEITWLIS